MWTDIAARKRHLRDQLIAPYQDNVDRPPQVQNVHERSQIESEPQVQKITDIDNVASLLKQIEKGEWSAEDVTRAYIKR